MIILPCSDYSTLINCLLNCLNHPQAALSVEQILNVKWKWEENGAEHLGSSHNSSVSKSTHLLMRVPGSLRELNSPGEHEKKSDTKMCLRCTVRNQGNVLEPAHPELPVGRVNHLQQQMYSNHYVILG